MREFILRPPSLQGHLRWLCLLLAAPHRLALSLQILILIPSPYPVDRRVALALLTAQSLVVPLYINFLG